MKVFFNFSSSVCFATLVRMGNSLEQHRQVIGGFFSRASKVKKSRANRWEPWESDVTVDSWQVDLCINYQSVKISWIFKTQCGKIVHWPGEQCKDHHHGDDAQRYRGGLFQLHQHDAVDHVWDWNKSWPMYLPNKWWNFDVAWKLTEWGKIIRRKA